MPTPRYLKFESVLMNAFDDNASMDVEVLTFLPAKVKLTHVLNTLRRRGVCFKEELVEERHVLNRSGVFNAWPDSCSSKS